ncbi:MAG: methyltransferase domain-containing protein [Bacteroidia bacterium]|nr:methyltransferase domain-containing protein [Bacteroidia bacterium]
MSELSAGYWNERYARGNFPWDAGAPTRPLVEYIDHLENKSLEILVPGAGSAHEGGYLHQKGFPNVHILDWSPLALERFQQNQPDFPADHLHCIDFFDLEGQFDLILEQTFFCALDPSLRPDWVRQMHALLKPGGKVAGLLFDFPLTDQGPPFGGSANEYEGLFQEKFQILTLERCTNSIKPRAGSELFFELRKK